MTRTLRRRMLPGLFTAALPTALSIALSAGFLVGLSAAATPARTASPGAIPFAVPVAKPMAAQLAGPPSTASLGDAQAKARALRLAVDRLQLQAEQASEAYDAAYDALGRAVTAHLSAEKALDAAVSHADDSATTAGRRVRALYMSGGTPALYATVLQGSDISDVLTRLQSVRRVVGADQTVRAAAGQAVADRAKAEADLAKLAARQTTLQASVAGRADTVRALLAQTDALLAQADAQVRAIAEQQRLAAEAAAAARAAAALAAAQRQAGLAFSTGDAFATGNVPAPTQAAAAAIAEAMTHLGQPYLWGGVGPAAFDCSGLTLTAYRAAGIALPRTAQEQWYAGPHVALGDLQPGDLLFWATDLADPSTIHHVALYLGNGQMIAAPHTGVNIQIQPVYLDGYIGAVRPSVAAGLIGP